MGRSQGLYRALILLGLGGLACKPTPEVEPAGNPPAFHDQLLYDYHVVAPQGAVESPKSLAVDVQRDAIHLRVSREHLSFPRNGSTTFAETYSQVPVRVPGDDRFRVWHVDSSSTDSSTEREIRAAHTDQPDRSWPLLEYAPADAVAEPIVMGEHVVVMTAGGLVHAPIRGGAPGLLALSHAPKGPLSSDAGRLVWVAGSNDRDLVLSIDTRFDQAQVEWELPQREGQILTAVLVGGSIVVASIDRVNNVPADLVVRRKRQDGSTAGSRLGAPPSSSPGAMVELLRGPTPGDELRLLADGTQAWLYTAKSLWWIGPHSHAKIPEFTAEVIAIGADDGLLLWQTEAGVVHVAGQPTVEFQQPFRPKVAIGGDDEEFWGSLVDPPYPEPRVPRHRVSLKKHQVDGALDRDIVRRIVRAHVDEVRSCYDAGFQRDPSLRGEIELEFVIDPSGLVAQVEDRTGDDFADHEVSGCVARAMRRWKFPKPTDGGSVTVRYPIMLSPGD